MCRDTAPDPLCFLCGGPVVGWIEVPSGHPHLHDTFFVTAIQAIRPSGSLSKPTTMSSFFDDRAGTRVIVGHTACITILASLRRTLPACASVRWKPFAAWLNASRSRYCGRIAGVNYDLIDCYEEEEFGFMEEDLEYVIAHPLLLPPVVVFGGEIAQSDLNEGNSSDEMYSLLQQDVLNHLGTYDGLFYQRYEIPRPNAGLNVFKTVEQTNCPAQKLQKTTVFSSLPAEIFQEVCRLLPPEALAQLDATHSTIRFRLFNENVWRERCIDAGFLMRFGPKSFHLPHSTITSDFRNVHWKLFLLQCMDRCNNHSRNFLRIRKMCGRVLQAYLTSLGEDVELGFDLGSDGREVDSFEFEDNSNDGENSDHEDESEDEQEIAENSLNDSTSLAKFMEDSQIGQNMYAIEAKFRFLEQDVEMGSLLTSHIIDQYKLQLNSSSSRSGLTDMQMLVQFAVEKQNTSLLQELLNLGVHSNLPSVNGNNLLGYVCKLEGERIKSPRGLSTLMETSYLPVFKMILPYFSLADIIDQSNSFNKLSAPIYGNSSLMFGFADAITQRSIYDKSPLTLCFVGNLPDFLDVLEAIVPSDTFSFRGPHAEWNKNTLAMCVKLKNIAAANWLLTRPYNVCVHHLCSCISTDSHTACPKPHCANWQCVGWW
ncbi:hypothetical protein HDU83_001243 [Entophlyctis luteolus]|nr:hypothetical protein HDU83_001243 [Entophlyctis luteolus]